MKSRQARLRRLLDIRQLKESSTRQEYGLAMRAEERARVIEQQNEARLRDARDFAVDALHAGSLTVQGLVRMNEEILFREHTRLGAVVQRRRRTATREHAELAYRSARRDSKSLERLAERHREAEERDRRRIEQKSTDEAALRRYAIAVEEQTGNSLRDEH